MNIDRIIDEIDYKAELAELFPNSDSEEIDEELLDMLEDW